ncbi:C32 tRNA thiolase [Bordetella pertussis]|nr:C32 tRNA thiolase [Bordetella pertussis]
MPPKLVSDDGRHTVIRPLVYVPESDLIAYAQFKQFPIIPCNLCGSQENLKRKEVGRMIQEWDRKHPGRSWNVFNALSRVVPSHLMDRDLFDFVGLKPTGWPTPAATPLSTRSIPSPIRRARLRQRRAGRPGRRHGRAARGLPLGVKIQ